MERDRLTQEAHQLHARLCAALADPRRIRALYALAQHSHTVNELAAVLRIPQSAASHHLKILRERGLVQTVRRGVSVEYHLADARIIEALDLLRAVLRATVLQQNKFLGAAATETRKKEPGNGVRS